MLQIFIEEAAKTLGYKIQIIFILVSPLKCLLAIRQSDVRVSKKVENSSDI